MHGRSRNAFYFVFRTGAFFNFTDDFLYYDFFSSPGVPSFPQTVQALIRHRLLLLLIWAYSVCHRILKADWLRRKQSLDRQVVLSFHVQGIKK